MIRKAKKGDIDAIKEIDHIVSLEEDRGQFIERSVKSDQVYLMEDNNRLLGYAVIKDDFFACPFIEMLYICEEERGKGFGPVLLQKMVEITVEDKVFSSTNQSNKHMQHVFKREGWTESGIIHNLDEGDPEIIFCKKVEKDEH